MRILDQAGVSYEIHTYDVSDDLIDGVSVARKCNEDPEQVFKTLVTVGNDKEHYVFVIPVAEKLDLKECAKAVGVKSVEMIPQKDLLKLTGYIDGQEKDPLLIEELKYVRMHSTLGYEELKGQGYSDFVLESILYHHENYDGSGYPSNKAGDDIPIGARILRVCDVYAALISDRPYRRGFDISSVMELMIDEVKNFDMQVFLAFQRVVHNGDGQNFYKRGGQHGIKEETGNRYEGHFTKRDGNP